MERNNARNDAWQPVRVMFRPEASVVKWVLRWLLRCDLVPVA